MIETDLQGLRELVERMEDEQMLVIHMGETEDEE